MGLTWDYHALPGLVAAALQLTMAGLVLGLAPSARQNRWMATFLGLDAALPLFVGLVHLVPTHPTQADFDALRAFFVLLMWCIPPAAAALLCFLSTLGFRILAFLQSWVAKAGLMVVAVAAGAGTARATPAFVLENGQGPDLQATTWTFFLLLATGVVSLAFAFAAVLRTKPKTPQRRQARAYAVAFGLRDSLLVGFLAVAWLNPGGLMGADDPETARWISAIPAFIAIIFVVLLAVGIATTELFRSARPLRMAIRGSSVAGILAGAFFVVEQGVQQMLPVSGFVPATLAAAAVALLVLPVHKTVRGALERRREPGPRAAEASSEASP